MPRVVPALLVCVQQLSCHYLPYPSFKKNKIKSFTASCKGAQMLSPNCGVQNKQRKREKTVRKECWLPWMGWLFGYLTHGKPSKQHFLLHFIITRYHILCTFAITSDTQLHASRPMLRADDHIWPTPQCLDFSSNQTGLIVIIFSKPSIRCFSFNHHTGSADLSQVPQQVCRIPHFSACDKQYFLVTESRNCLGPKSEHVMLLTC